MAGVVGGVSSRTQLAGQAPVQYPDLLSAATVVLQSGGGAYARLTNALQSLDQTANIAALAAAIGTSGDDITTLQAQVATLQAQVAAQQVTINSLSYLQTEVSTGTIYLDQRTIYKRSFVINGALETALNVFTYPHGVPAINYIVDIQAMAGAAGGQQFPVTFLNMATAPSLSAGLSCWADANNIFISVGSVTFSGQQVLATMWYTATNR